MFIPKFVWQRVIKGSDKLIVEIVKLRGGDKGDFELFLMSDLEEAHSNKIISMVLSNK